MDQDFRTIVTIVGHEPDFGELGELVSFTGRVASCCGRGRCMQRPCEWFPGKFVNTFDPMYIIRHDKSNSFYESNPDQSFMITYLYFV